MSMFGSLWINVQKTQFELFKKGFLGVDSRNRRFSDSGSPRSKQSFEKEKMTFFQ